MWIPYANRNTSKNEAKCTYRIVKRGRLARIQNVYNSKKILAENYILTYYSIWLSQRLKLTLLHLIQSICDFKYKSVKVSLEMQFSIVSKNLSDFYLNFQGYYSFLSHDLIPLDFFYQWRMSGLFILNTSLVFLS